MGAARTRAAPLLRRGRWLVGWGSDWVAVGQGRHRQVAEHNRGLCLVVQGAVAEYSNLQASHAETCLAGVHDRLAVQQHPGLISPGSYRHPVPIVSAGEAVNIGAFGDG